MLASAELRMSHHQLAPGCRVMAFASHVLSLSGGAPKERELAGKHSPLLCQVVPIEIGCCVTDFHRWGRIFQAEP